MIGFVILNFCTYKKTIECVLSIYATYKLKKKIIIIDNASPNNSYDYLINYFNKKRFYEVEVIRAEKNGGFAYGNNLGTKRLVDLDINYAILTNNDIVFKESTIKRLVEVLEKKENERVVMVGPQILNTQEEIISLPWKSHQSLLQFLGIKSAKNLIYQKEEMSEIQNVYMISGCCFAINVQKFVNMGAIDEGTFLYMEEGTMAMQAQKSNLAIVYVNNASVIHEHGASTKPGLFSDGEIIKSALFYWRKYERANKFQLFFIWSFFVIKCFLKIITRKVSSKGFVDIITSTFEKLLVEAKNTRSI